MRVHFATVQLSGSSAANDASSLRLTSVADGSTQVLDADGLNAWANSFAAFNGDAVALELPAYPSTVTHSNVKGGWLGASNLGPNVDPLFVDPANDDYRLQAGSPCRNAAHNASLPADVADVGSNGNKTERLPKDFALMARIEGDSVDLGAFEWHPPGK